MRRWRVILKRIVKKWDERIWTGSIWFRIETGRGSCERGNEPLGFIKSGEFIDYLRTCSLLKKRLYSMNLFS
jgi:Predicted methyltransferases